MRLNTDKIAGMAYLYINEIEDKSLYSKISLKHAEDDYCNIIDYYYDENNKFHLHGIEIWTTEKYKYSLDVKQTDEFYQVRIIDGVVPNNKREVKINDIDILMQYLEKDLVSVCIPRILVE